MSFFRSTRFAFHFSFTVVSVGQSESVIVRWRRLLGKRCTGHFVAASSRRTTDSSEHYVVLNCVDREMAMPCVCQFLKEN